MSDTNPISEQSNPFDPPRDYGLLALGGLLVVTLLLFVDGVGVVAFLPLLVGTLSILSGRGPGPALTLFLLFLVLLIREFFVRTFPPPDAMSPLTALAYSAALLVYVIGHSRLLTLRGQAIPGDPRRGKRIKDERVIGRWLFPIKESGRSPDNVRQGEFLGLLGVIPLVLLTSYLLWVNISLYPETSQVVFPPLVRRLLILAWLSGAALILGWALTGYLSRVGATPQESHLFLLDQFWSVTQAEQRKITRWLVRTRLARQNREDKS